MLGKEQKKSWPLGTKNIAIRAEFNNLITQRQNKVRKLHD